MPLKSAIEFLIFACVIISWPLRMPPSRRPMMTSTMAISTSVKPRARTCDFILPPVLVAPLARGCRESITTPKQCLTRVCESGFVQIPTRLSNFRRLARRRPPRFELFQPVGEEARLGRIADRAARQQSAEHDAGGLELVHVLEDEDLHVLRP